MDDKQEIIDILRKTKNYMNYAKSEMNQLSQLLEESFAINSKIINNENVNYIKNKINSQIILLDNYISSTYND